ncbi:MAG TPA: Holliday junction resolvase RuvX [Candidatus Baltobacteraceae bacterium]|jgi:putative Holliday junction resolvase|nr:Holliday junction resolvase RuvX [Candidatus Baltobacteraceae bacterium]
MSLLALDVGSKRIGVAVADPTGTFALPLTVIDRTNLKADLQRISELAAQYNAKEMVVGDPVTLSGARGPAAENIDRFVEQLARVFGGRIHRVDERMTTAQATKSLIAADVSRSKRKTVVDKMAAALILETFLTRRRSAAPQ